ncbi:UNVERIFIED_ORG: putative MFS family arabinose efflux permease [Sphingomonas sp. R1F5B]
MDQRVAAKPQVTATPSALSEFRRGWSSVLAAALGVGVGTTGLPFYSFGLFIAPLSAAYGWSRGQIGLGMTCLSLGAILLSPFLGTAIDRLGVRRIALVSLAGLAVGFALLAAALGSLPAFYAAWIALAFLGVGTTPITWTRPIALLFDRGRGLALGLTLLGTGLVALTAPPLLAAVIATWGPRGGYLAMAGVVVLVVMPVVAAGLREGPSGRSDAVPHPRSGLTRQQALRSRQFWQIAIGVFLLIVAQSGATVHVVPFLADHGLTPGLAAKMAGSLGISVIVGRVVIGLLLDLLPGTLVARCVLLMPAAALALLFLAGPSLPMTALAILLLGFAAGAETDLVAYLTSRYFGMRAYGAIYGLLMSCFSLGAALGAPLAGWSFDLTKSYDGAILGGIACFVAAAVLLGTLGAYPTDRVDEEPA